MIAENNDLFSTTMDTLRRHTWLSASQSIM